MKTIKELLAFKRDGGEWNAEEIRHFVDGVVHSTVSPPQASAFLMASCIRGLTVREAAVLTQAMAASGHQLGKNGSARKTIDKHSTGGVGDKVSLLLAPLAASCGVSVPMISGRGLGHTGGTVDKLESVLGFRTQLELSEMESLLKHHYLFMAGQTADIAPADKILYALRDSTGTVENTSLITASILSKKLAEGLDGLVMDIKVGKCAFMKTMAEATTLADSMQTVATEAGLPIRIVFTSMDEPLGKSVGNWVEMVEAEQALNSRLKANPRLVEVTLELTSHMLMLADISDTLESARAMVCSKWDDGTAFKEFHRMLARQEGMWEQSVDYYNNLHSHTVVAPFGGIIAPFNGMDLSLAVMRAGGGRLRETDEIDHAVGVQFLFDRGQVVEQNQPIAIVTASTQRKCDALSADVHALIQMQTAPLDEEPSLIISSM